METLFSDDRGDPCDRSDPCVWIIRDTTRVYLKRSIRKKRFFSIARITSVVWEERFHIIVSVASIVSVVSKNLKRQRRSLRQRQSHGNQALVTLAYAFSSILEILVYSRSTYQTSMNTAIGKTISIIFNNIPCSIQNLARTVYRMIEEYVTIEFLKQLCYAKKIIGSNCPTKAPSLNWIWGGFWWQPFFTAISTAACRAQACRQGCAMGANAPPTGRKGPPEGSKDKLTKKKNAKDESFLLICQHTHLFRV